MEVIALKGESNSGKTTTLKLLMGRLLNGEGSFLESYFRLGTVRRMIAPADEKWYTNKAKINISDLTVTLMYKGKLVIITSMGDAKRLIVGSLLKAKRRLEKKGITNTDPDIFICACHPKMDLEKMLGCKLVNYIKKEKTTEDIRDDCAAVEMIIAELNRII